MDSKYKIRAVVVDDEPWALNGVASLLKDDMDFMLVAKCLQPEEAVLTINNELPDVVFLDVQMPRMNGFEVLDHVQTEKMPLVVFVTAFDSYALRAFKVHAIDYLLKPFDDDQFYVMLKRVKKLFHAKQLFENEQKTLSLVHNIRNPDLEPKQGQGTYLNRIYLKDFKGITFLEVKDIKWLIAEDYYVWIHVSGKRHLFRQTMKFMEAKLDPTKFVRISRSMTIRMDLVRKIERLADKNFIAITKTEEHFKISYSRLSKVKRALQK